MGDRTQRHFMLINCSSSLSSMWLILLYQSQSLQMGSIWWYSGHNSKSPYVPMTQECVYKAYKKEGTSITKYNVRTKIRKKKNYELCLNVTWFDELSNIIKLFFYRG